MTSVWEDSEDRRLLGAASKPRWHCCPGTGTRGPSYENGRELWSAWSGRLLLRPECQGRDVAEGRMWAVLCMPGNKRQNIPVRRTILGSSQVLSTVPLEHLDRCRMGGAAPNPRPSNSVLPSRGAKGHLWPLGPCNGGE